MEESGKTPNRAWVKRKIGGYEESGMGSPSGYVGFKKKCFDNASEAHRSRIRNAIKELITDVHEEPYVRVVAAHVAAEIGMENAAQYLDRLEQETKYPGLVGILRTARALYIEKKSLAELLRETSRQNKHDN